MHFQLSVVAPLALVLEWPNSVISDSQCNWRAQFEACTLKIKLRLLETMDAVHDDKSRKMDGTVQCK